MRSIQYLLIFSLIWTVCIGILTSPILAQTITPDPELNQSTDSATLELATESATVATPSSEEVEKLEIIRKEDITKPEEIDEKVEFLELFGQRPIDRITLFNALAASVQYAVIAGVPANTIILIMLLPWLATLVAFARHIIGLPTLGLLVPLAFSITFMATGLLAGLLLLGTIILGSLVARFSLKRIRIMNLPKLSLSMLIISMFVFTTMVLAASNGLLAVKQLSIFPVLLLILLSERIISLTLSKNLNDMMYVTFTNLGIGIIGFLLLSWTAFRNQILLYPELCLLLIPINILIGRYFGLRLTEYFRFRPFINKHGS